MPRKKKSEEVLEDQALEQAEAMAEEAADTAAEELDEAAAEETAAAEEPTESAADDATEGAGEAAEAAAQDASEHEPKAKAARRGRPRKAAASKADQAIEPVPEPGEDESSPYADWTMRQIGQEGERIARKFLEKLDYTILETNWIRVGREADIVAQDGDCLTFVEVKTTVASPDDPEVIPEARVGEKKRERYRIVAEMYMEEHPDFKDLRFDVVAINLIRKGYARIMHVKDAFRFDGE